MSLVNCALLPYSLHRTRSLLMMAFAFQPQLAHSLLEQERSTSRSSVSTHSSSIIDPGDEKSELSLDESPTKKLCTEYNRVSFEFNHSELECSKDSASSPHYHTHLRSSATAANASPSSVSSMDKCKPLRSFLIKDILSHNSDQPGSDSKSDSTRGFIRPWDSEASQNHYLSQLNVASSLFQSLQYNAAAAAALSAGIHPNLTLFHGSYHSALSNYRLVSNRRPRSADDDSRSERSESDSPASPASNSNNNQSSPLDALFEMTSKAFDRNDTSDKSSDPSSDHLNMFNNRNNQIKKKRKSRTAFTNHQIFELEKRFLYQKYLSPADRDEIAQSLGLTNAQVITWFQNRRAKLKRDVEELKKDVDAAKITSVHTSLLENIQDLSMLKKTEIVAALQQHAAAAAAAQHNAN